MNKEDIINILNQHGIDALYDTMNDTISHAYSSGYAIGYDDGWHECCDTFEDKE